MKKPNRIYRKLRALIHGNFTMWMNSGGPARLKKNISDRVQVLRFKRDLLLLFIPLQMLLMGWMNYHYHIWLNPKIAATGLGIVFLTFFMARDLLTLCGIAGLGLPTLIGETTVRILVRPFYKLEKVKFIETADSRIKALAKGIFEFVMWLVGIELAVTFIFLLVPAYEWSLGLTIILLGVVGRLVFRQLQHKPVSWKEAEIVANVLIIGGGLISFCAWAFGWYFSPDMIPEYGRAHAMDLALAVLVVLVFVFWDKKRWVAYCVIAILAAMLIPKLWIQHMNSEEQQEQRKAAATIVPAATASAVPAAYVPAAPSVPPAPAVQPIEQNMPTYASSGADCAGMRLIRTFNVMTADRRPVKMSGEIYFVPERVQVFSNGSDTCSAVIFGFKDLGIPEPGKEHKAFCLADSSERRQTYIAAGGEQFPLIGDDLQFGMRMKKPINGRLCMEYNQAEALEYIQFFHGTIPTQFSWTNPAITDGTSLPVVARPEEEQGF